MTGEPPRDEDAASRSVAMPGRALELLDTRIGAWSRWDLHEDFYLGEHALRIVRSDDPDFPWLDQDDQEQRARGGRAQAIERVTVVQLKEVMLPGEWHILPELLRERRGLRLHELEWDDERQRREAEQWPVAVERAYRDGAARMRRESAEAQGAGERAERELLERQAEVARRIEMARRAQREREDLAQRETAERERKERDAGEPEAAPIDADTEDAGTAAPPSNPTPPPADEPDDPADTEDATPSDTAAAATARPPGDPTPRPADEPDDPAGTEDATPSGTEDAVTEEPPNTTARPAARRSRMREKSLPRRTPNRRLTP